MIPKVHPSRKIVSLIWFTPRSHSIFAIRIEMSEPDEASSEEKIKVGKLNLVDLAGSERQGKTGLFSKFMSRFLAYSEYANSSPLSYFYLLL